MQHSARRVDFVDLDSRELRWIGRTLGTPFFTGCKRAALFDQLMKSGGTISELRAKAMPYLDRSWWWDLVSVGAEVARVSLRQCGLTCEPQIVNGRVTAVLFRPPQPASPLHAPATLKQVVTVAGKSPVGAPYASGARRCKRAAAVSRSLCRSNAPSALQLMAITTRELKTRVLCLSQA